MAAGVSLVVSVAEGVDVQAVSPIARLSVATIAAEKSGRRVEGSSCFMTIILGCHMGNFEGCISKFKGDYGNYMKQR